MRKGFTLVELLAVIVILALIALITVPTVLRTITNSKNNTTLMSVEFYLAAVEISIANFELEGKNIENGTYNIINDGNICLIYESDNKNCAELLYVDAKGSRPTGGNIVINNGKILGFNILLNEKEITENSKGELLIVKTLDEVCKYVSGTPKTAGAKYECKVDPNKDPYTFYVLTTPKETDTRINLIMDRNINSDGTPATKAIKKATPENGVYNLVEWIDYSTYISSGGNYVDWNNFTNNMGPLTAMNFLYNATKKWTNTNEMVIDHFNDNADNLFEIKPYITYARMPYYNEVSSSNGSNEYLYEHLEGSSWVGSGTKPTNNTQAIWGYWTISAAANSSANAWLVHNNGVLVNFHVARLSYGVRPVISLKI